MCATVLDCNNFQDTVSGSISENLFCENRWISDVFPTLELPSNINFRFIMLGSGFDIYVGHENKQIIYTLTISTHTQPV